MLLLLFVLSLIYLEFPNSLLNDFKICVCPLYVDSLLEGIVGLLLFRKFLLFDDGIGFCGVEKTVTLLLGVIGAGLETTDRPPAEDSAAWAAAVPAAPPPAAEEMSEEGFPAAAAAPAAVAASNLAPAADAAAAAAAALADGALPP